MGYIFYCLCVKSWSLLECCACCYAYHKITSCCSSVATKISNCFKGCYQSITKCCNDIECCNNDYPAQELPQSNNQFGSLQPSSAYSHNQSNTLPPITSSYSTNPFDHLTTIPVAYPAHMSKDVVMQGVHIEGPNDLL